jgi:hypothetical protein
MNSEVRKFLTPQEPSTERLAAETVLSSIGEDDYADPTFVVNRLVIASRLLHTEDGKSVSLLIDRFRDAWEKLGKEASSSDASDAYRSYMARAIKEAKPHADRILNLDITSVAGIRRELEKIREELQ